MYDRSDPGAARAINVAGSDFEGFETEIILARNSNVPAAWIGTKPDADHGAGYEIGNAVRTRAAAIRGDE